MIYKEFFIAAPSDFLWFYQNEGSEFFLSKWPAFTDLKQNNHSSAVPEKNKTAAIFLILNSESVHSRLLVKTPVLPVLCAGFFSWQLYMANQRVRTGRYSWLDTCDHPYIRKGYYLGLDPEVYVCVRCGEQRRPERWDDFARRRMPPKGPLNNL
ncbi:hypothetical protein [Pseudomonas sp. R5-89-07]|uniref:hypothetical protein n=1 Tax=Pseudomonas sp. R5-89-07 TaxID=658644 RepID=UPI0013DE2F14|nr:hypothetical protein [Pseudomonas sp. R5-89-07]